MNWRVADKDESLKRLEADLAPELVALRTSARGYAERARPASLKRIADVVRLAPEPSQRTAGRGWVTGAALAAACCAVAVPFVRHRPVQATVPAITANAHGSTPTDEAVLSSVDADLRNAVPAAMQPLSVSTLPNPAASAAVRKD